MTTDDLKRLTPKQKYIEIARACNQLPPPCKICAESGEVRYHDLPDYLNDLNAMALARKTLDYEQHDAYWRNLLRVVDPNDTSVDSSRWTCADANATQHADAFLLTVGTSDLTRLEGKA